MMSALNKEDTKHGVGKEYLELRDDSESKNLV